MNSLTEQVNRVACLLIERYRFGPDAVFGRLLTPSGWGCYTREAAHSVLPEDLYLVRIGAGGITLDGHRLVPDGAECTGAISVGRSINADGSLAHGDAALAQLALRLSGDPWRRSALLYNGEAFLRHMH